MSILRWLRRAWRVVAPSPYPVGAMLGVSVTLIPVPLPQRFIVRSQYDEAFAAPEAAV